MYSMRSALTHQPIVYQEFGCCGFESYDSYEGVEGSDGFEKLSGMYFGRLCAIVALKGFGAPFIRNLVAMGLKAMIAMKALKAHMALGP